MEKYKKKARTILWIGVAIACLFPAILSLDSFVSFFDFTQTGPIGDTIGGTTAPFISLIGAILVYYALIAQIDANVLLKKQIDDDKKFQIVSEQYRYLEQNVNAFKFKDFLTGIEFDPSAIEESGSRAFHSLFSRIECFHGTDEELLEDPAVAEMYSILEIMHQLLVQMKEQDREDMLMIRTLIKHLFDYKIMPAIRHRDMDSLVSKYCKDCDCEHGIPMKMAELIVRIRVLLS